MEPKHLELLVALAEEHSSYVSLHGFTLGKALDVAENLDVLKPRIQRINDTTVTLSFDVGAFSVTLFAKLDAVKTPFGPSRECFNDEDVSILDALEKEACE